jgi:hypothetical protein
MWVAVFTTSMQSFYQLVMAISFPRFTESDEPVWRGYLYVVAITVTLFANLFIRGQYVLVLWKIGITP